MTAPTTLAGRIAAEIRAEMAWQQKTTRELAEVLGVQLRTAQRRYAGDQDYSLDEVAVIADWLDVSRGQILTGVRDREIAVAS